MQSKGGEKIFGHLVYSGIRSEVKEETVVKSYLESVLLKKWRGAEGDDWRFMNNNSKVGDMDIDGEIYYTDVYKENGVNYHRFSFYPLKFSIDMDLSMYKVATIELSLIDDVSDWFDGDLLVDESVYHHYCKNAKWRDITYYSDDDLPF